MSVEAENTEHDSEIEESAEKVIDLLKRIVVLLEMMNDMNPGESQYLIDKED